jgi:hypothetical protein
VQDRHQKMHGREPARACDVRPIRATAFFSGRATALAARTSAVRTCVGVHRPGDDLEGVRDQDQARGAGQVASDRAHCGQL